MNGQSWAEIRDILFGREKEDHVEILSAVIMNTVCLGI
jgi:hypothetical protein